MCILLIISGVEENAAPSLSQSSRSFSSVSDLSSDCSVLNNNVSFPHLNVQSIVQKLDIITAEYSSYDILSFTESWLKPNVNDETLKLLGYKFPPFRRDRQNKTGGGVIVYIKEHINCIIRPDLQIDNIECLWIEIKFKSKKYLYGTFYIPHDSGSQSWLDIEQSIDLALNSNHDILIPPLPDGGVGYTVLPLSVCLSFRPSKIFFVAFFSVTVDGRNLIFGHKHHIGIPYCG